MERLQKILAHGGIASRRAAEELITAGRVRVNGRVVTELGAKADPRSDRIEVDGKRVVAEEPVYVVVHKPRGVVATMSDPEGRPTVREIVETLGARVYPVGRLDFATSGVLLVTNDGAFADGLLHPKRAVPKTYVVKVKGKMEPDDLDRWREGVELEDGKTLAAEAKMVRYEGDKTWFELTIREGRNQQIRRMGEATGFPVMRLARVAFAGISGEGLRPGQWRHLRRDELSDLKKTFGVPRSIPAISEPTQAPGGARRTAPHARKVGAKHGPAGADRGPSQRGADRGPSRHGAEREPSQRGAERGPSRHGADRGPSRPGADRGPSRPGADRGPSRHGADRGPSRPGADRGPSRPGGDRGPSRPGGDRGPSRPGGDRGRSRRG